MDAAKANQINRNVLISSGLNSDYSKEPPAIARQGSTPPPGIPISATQGELGFRRKQTGRSGSGFLDLAGKFHSQSTYQTFGASANPQIGTAQIHVNRPANPFCI
jgi:hypothetical protein